MDDETKMTHAPDCGEVGETGEHGDIGANAAEQKVVAPPPDDPPPPEQPTAPVEMAGVLEAFHQRLLALEDRVTALEGRNFIAAPPQVPEALSPPEPLAAPVPPAEPDPPEPPTSEAEAPQA
jgi:hypothetical protein